MPSRPPEGSAHAAKHRALVRRLAIFGIALAALEGAARILAPSVSAWRPEVSPVVDAVNPVPVFEAAEARGRKVFLRTSHHPLIGPNAGFLAEKPAGGLRVFVLGGLAAGGWPFDTGGWSTADQIERKLRRLYPDRSVEVVDVEGANYASHRVRFVLEEVLDYQPDLVVIYSGNSEFRESFVFRPAPPPGPLRQLALARVVHHALRVWTAARPTFDVAGYTLADQTSSRLSYAFGRPSDARCDPAEFEGVVARYRHNLESMVRAARARGVPVLLTTVPVNLKEWSPNASRHRADLSPGERARWQERFRGGVLAREAGDPAAAAAALAEASALDPAHAETWFELGTALHALGRMGEAKAAFLRALEEDAYPFRALPRFQTILREIAAAEGVPLVDLMAALEARTSDGILGLDVMVDYVHLSEESQELVAHELLGAAQASGFLPEPRAVALDAAREAPPHDFRAALDVRALEVLYRQYLVMRQYERLDDVYERYAAVLVRARKEQPDMAAQASQRLDLARSIQRVIRPYRRLLRAERLGIVEQEFTEDGARRVYGDYIRLVRSLEAPAMPQEQFRKFVPPLRYGPPAAAAPPGS